MQVADRIIPKAPSLSGFDNSIMIMNREITISSFAGVVKNTTFQVVITDMAYNIILGRPRIHEIDAVLSILHQVIKFPSKVRNKTNQWQSTCSSGDKLSSYC